MKIIVSCSGKFHAFALVEQLQKNGFDVKLYTSFSSIKNNFFKRFVSRLDKELIDKTNIKTNILIAIGLKLFPNHSFVLNNLFDRWVSRSLKKQNYDVFIGWSGMSLYSIRQVKKSGKLAIVERGSSHIEYQNEILVEEYAKFGIAFSIDKRVIKKELAEYDEADYISIPSNFVYTTFIDKNIKGNVILLNQYGVQLNHWKRDVNIKSSSEKLRIVYLGTLSFQKGLQYLFSALNILESKHIDHEMHFIGSIDKDFKTFLDRSIKDNWLFYGHIPQHNLIDIIQNFDIAIQPSLQEGLSMVLAQLLASNIPVISTTNTGGMEFINDGINGFIIPIRDSEAIAEKIQIINADRKLLHQMKIEAKRSVMNGFTWDDYGDRWKSNLSRIM